jgi:hypothetical protein
MAGGSIEIFSRSGQIQMDPTATSIAPVIRYHASSDVLLGSLSALGGGVVIESAHGDILTVSVAATQVAALTAQLNAPNGAVGSALAPILVDVDILSAVAGDGLFVTDLNDLALGAVPGLRFDRLTLFGSKVPIVTSDGAGVRSGGAIVVQSTSGPLHVDALVDAHGPLLLQTLGAAQDLILNAPVRTQAGDLSLLSAGGIQQASTVAAGIAESGHSVDIQTFGGPLSMTPLARTTTLGGSINVNAAGSIALGQLDARSLVDRVLNGVDDQSQWGDVSLTTVGSISDATNGARVNLFGNDLTLRVNSGRIGLESAGITMPLRIDAVTVAVDGPSDIALQDETGLVIGTTDTIRVMRIDAAGVPSLLTGSGLTGLNEVDDLLISTGPGDLVVEEALVANNVLMLESRDPAGNILIQADLTSASHLTVNAGGDVVQDATLVSGDGTVFVQSREGSLTMLDGAVTETNGRNIRYAASNDIILELLDARTNDDRLANDEVAKVSWGKISVVSFDGSIFDGDAAGDVIVNIHASEVRFTAAGQIGIYVPVPNAIEVNVLMASAAANNGINVDGTFIFATIDPVLVQQVGFDGLTPVQDPGPQAFFTDIQSDFDGDGKADVAVFDRTIANWTIRLSGTGEEFTVRYAFPEDIPLRGDFDNDGKADLMVYRPSEGRWGIGKRPGPGVTLPGQLEIGITLYIFDFGNATSVPMLGDVTGDAQIDLIIYQPESGLWQVMNPLDLEITTFDLGLPNTQAFVGDFDGDGLTDFGNFDAGTFTIRRSSDGVIVTDAGVGGTDWVAMIGDYSGDGLADTAAYNPASGEWQYRNSDTGQLEQITFQGPGLYPANGDFDEDGILDIVVFDAATRFWYIRSSSSQALLLFDPSDTDKSLELGLVNSLPVNDALIQDIVLDIFGNL